MLLLYFRVIVKLFPIVALSPAFSQITLFSDLYIAPKNELHIVSGNLYFEKGKIILLEKEIKNLKLQNQKYKNALNHLIKRIESLEGVSDQ